LNQALKESNLIDTGNLHKKRRITKILLSSKEPIIRLIAVNITDQQSLSLEVFMISKIGRRDKKHGPLTNQTDGGEGSSGLFVSDHTKSLLSEKAIQQWKDWSDEQRKCWAKQHSDSMIVSHASMSPAERLVRNSNQSSGIKEYYKGLSPEQRQVRKQQINVDKIKETYRNMSPQRKTEISISLLDSQKKHYYDKFTGKSEKEIVDIYCKSATSNSTKNKILSMTEDERHKYALMRRNRKFESKLKVAVRDGTDTPNMDKHLEIITSPLTELVWELKQ
jgi:hypothetical protein